MSFSLPVFDNRFFCIVNRDSTRLAALISSYTYNKDFYTLFFECNTATISKPEEEFKEKFHEDSISDISLRELDVKLSNALNMVGSCDYLVLGGLDDKQKSYLTFLDKYNVIDIQREEEVNFYLGNISLKEGSIKCNERSILYGLYQAAHEDRYLEIDNSVDDLNLPFDNVDGLIIIEDINSVSVIMAINYSLSIGASIAIIPQVKISGSHVRSLIEKWKSGNAYAISDLKAEVYSSIENIDFSKYKFATFFTVGVPYSLILENIIPISHVHLYLNPDFFVFNGIYYESNFILESSIVFSPLEFIDEETEFVKEELSKNQYYVRNLVGRNATAHNLDFHIKDFPFNLMHICSHGGEIGGYEINETFKDRDGIIHSVKYDEVVTFAPSPGKELIPVTFKKIIREFNGFDWITDKTEKEKYPSYVFADMFNAIFKNKKPERKPLQVITDSCSIKCSDFNYQAMFNILAGVFSPIIFNNTCWSWYEIAQAFINSGARGYIGTLWNINNATAKACAEVFYKSLFNDTILNSLHLSLEVAKKTKDENIYMFWGLHFTTLPKGTSIEKSRLKITNDLLDSLERWKAKLSTSQDQYKKSISELIEWEALQLAGEFKKETSSLIVMKK